MAGSQYKQAVQLSERRGAAGDVTAAIQLPIQHVQGISITKSCDGPSLPAFTETVNAAAAGASKLLTVLQCASVFQGRC